MKKLITLLLTVTMLLGMMSMTTISAEETTEAQKPVVTAAVRIDGHSGIRFRVEFDTTDALTGANGDFGAFILSKENYAALSNVTLASLEEVAGVIKAKAGEQYDVDTKTGKTVVYYTIENFGDETTWYGKDITVVPYIGDTLFSDCATHRSLSYVAFFAVSDLNGDQDGNQYTEAQRKELYKYTQTFANTSLYEDTMIYYEGFDGKTGDLKNDLEWSKVSTYENTNANRQWTNTYTEDHLRVYGFKAQNNGDLTNRTVRWLIRDSAYMEKAYTADGFTIEYSVTYKTINQPNGYVGVFVNHNDGTNDDTAVYDDIVPMVGSYNCVRRYNTGNTYMEYKMDETKNAVAKDETWVYRVQVSDKYGVTLWAKKSDATVWQKLAYIEFNDFLSDTSRGFGLTVKNETFADIDYVAVWSGFGDMPADHSTNTYATLSSNP